MSKRSYTIDQFLEETQQQWREKMSKFDPEDRLSFVEWTEEWKTELRKEYGIYRDEMSGKWTYDFTNDNHPAFL